jgi:tRNA threonylcarbamoyladenosine biosynthesis protein TsaB
MKLLGIETATMVGSVAIVDQVDVVASYLWNIESAHSEHLMVAIEQILADASLSLQELDGVAVSIGPGSFTGLRIGLSTAKGLCYATGLPLVTVPTLDALASRLVFCKYQVCPMLDARKGEVYASIYQTADGEISRLCPPEAISPELLLRKISQSTVFSGKGAIVYRDSLLKSLGEKAYFAPPELNSPDAAAVARLGFSALQNGETAELFPVEPFYLRKPDAKISTKSTV